MSNVLADCDQMSTAARSVLSNQMPGGAGSPYAARVCESETAAVDSIASEASAQHVRCRVLMTTSAAASIVTLAGFRKYRDHASGPAFLTTRIPKASGASR